MIRLARGILLFLFLLVLPDGWASAQELDLNTLIQIALKENPGLMALKHRWEAFEARVPQAGALDDPMFKFEASNIPLNEFDFSSTPMSGNQLVFSQKVPLPGTLSAKEQAARQASVAAGAMLQDREGVVVNMVKQAYFTLAFLDRSIEITRRNEALLRDLIRIAQTKYAVGRGQQQDVLKAQVSLSGLKDRLIKLRTARKMAEARLNLMLNRLPQEPVGRPPGQIVPTSFQIGVEALQEVALESRPLLRGAEATIRQWSAVEAVARRQVWPSLTFNLGYRQRMLMAGDPVRGSDFLSFGVGLNLPIYRGRKQRKRVVEAQARIKMAEAQRGAARQKIFYEVQALHLEVAQHRAEVSLFESEILPQARQALKSAMAGYQVDKVSFWSLLNDQVILFNFEIDHYHHVIEHEKTLAELEAIVGKRLF